MIFLIFLFTKHGSFSVTMVVIFFFLTPSHPEAVSQFTNPANFTHLFSLVTQLVKNPPAMQETWVRWLGWEGPLE